MSVALSDMVARLQGLVSVRNGAPTTSQYTQAVKDAVGDLSRRSAIEKRTTINVVSGTASYALASDFLYVIKLANANTPNGVIISDLGIIVMDSVMVNGPARWSETWNVVGQTLTFYPTPVYSMARDLWYAAGHVLDATSSYATMNEEQAGIALLKAQALAISIKANAAVDEAWNYSIGPESVNKTQLAEAMRKRAADLEAEYLERVNRLVGALGVRGEYDAAGQ